MDFSFYGAGRPGQDERSGHGNSVIANPARDTHEWCQSAGHGIGQPMVQRLQVAIADQTTEALHQRVGGGQLRVFSQYARKHFVFNFIQLPGWTEAEPPYADASLGLALRWTTSHWVHLGRIAPGPERLR